MKVRNNEKVIIRKKEEFQKRMLSHKHWKVLKYSQAKLVPNFDKGNTLVSEIVGIFLQFFVVGN